VLMRSSKLVRNDGMLAFIGFGCGVCEGVAASVHFFACTSCPNAKAQQFPQHRFHLVMRFVH